MYKEEYNDRQHITEWMKKHNINYTETIDSESWRVKYRGPYLFSINADGLIFEFLPNGILDRCFTEVALNYNNALSNEIEDRLNKKPVNNI